MKFDRVHNTYCVTKHLIDLGHRSLGVFLSTDGDPETSNQPRAIGMRKACEESSNGGVPIQRMWFDVPFYAGPEAGVAIAERFLALAPSDRPTGMVLLNDRTAMTFIARVQASGIRVPEDVSVVGHDDDQMSAFFPVPLTTVTHPHRDLAVATADLMHRQLSGEIEHGEDHVIEVRGELRVRASTAAPSLPGP